MWKHLIVCVLFFAADDAAPPLSPAMEYEDIPLRTAMEYRDIPLRSGVGYNDIPRSVLYTCSLKERNKITFPSGLVIESGAKLQRIYLRFACIEDNEDMICAPFENIDFEGGDFSGANIGGLTFRNCSFRKCNFQRTDALATHFVDCDFTDAIIWGANLELSQEQLESTASYKKRLLYNTKIDLCPDKGQKSLSVNFSKCNLTRSTFENGYSLVDCRFDNAVINGVRFEYHTKFSKEQLMTTAGYKTKALQNVYIARIDLSGVDFSNFNLTGCQFGGSTGDADFTNVNFTNAVITNGDFNHIRNYYSPGEQGFQRALEEMDKQNRTLTVEQIKSTWNYKTGNMTGVLLPKYIQDELDKERKAKPK